MLDQQIKQKAVRRARIIEGQLRALTKGIEDEKYCPDLLNEIRAIQFSLKSLNRLILQNHIKSHVKHMLATKAGEEKAVKELSELIDLQDKYY